MPKTQIMGVINVTPDSFYDGGRYTGAETAAAHAVELERDGADYIDVGAESSRPGANSIGLHEELRRLLPALEAIGNRVRARISVDTYRAETARRALELGATMVNDITALRGDPAMAEVVAEAGCDCVLMHMLGTPRPCSARRRMRTWCRISAHFSRNGSTGPRAPGSTPRASGSTRVLASGKRRTTTSKSSGACANSRDLAAPY